MAGTGAEAIKEPITDRVKFRCRWMHQPGLQAFQCRILTVTGESMGPTLLDGCAILVNMGQRDPPDRRTFVVRIDNEAVHETARSCRLKLNSVRSLRGPA